MLKKIQYQLLFIAILLYIAIGVYTIYQITGWVTSEYYKTLGTKAMDIAEIASRSYYLTDSEVEELRALPFDDVRKHPANVRLNKLFEGGSYSQDFKYTYIMQKLNGDEIKYYVDESTAGHYMAPAGTPLNLFWLTDVIINSDERYEAENNPGYYDDVNRYSLMRGGDIAAYDARKTTYVVTNDEYGHAFTGLVPFYTVEGTFVGMLGVDIYFEGFQSHTANIRNAFTFVYLLPTIVLTVAYIIIYLKKYRRSSEEANTDPLTTLNNRRFLDNVLPRLVREHYRKHVPLSAIMIDVDCFKNYNDHYGHQQGDEVLIKISKVVSSVLRQNTDIVCRYGGEEIIVLLSNTDIWGAKYVAEKIKNTINNLFIPHEFSTAGHYVSVSQGIYSGVPESSNKETEQKYIEFADKALYNAKKSGRNSFSVYKEGEM